MELTREPLQNNKIKTMKKIASIISIAFLGLVLLNSCEKEYEQEELPGFKLSGEWYVQTYYQDTSTKVLGYNKILTYNTADADGKQLWVDDLGSIWPFKVRVSSNSEANSFSGTGTNAHMADTTMVTIAGGRVWENGTKSTSGVTTDSIYMEAEFSDDPGEKYIFAGYYRTGFVEDEH